MSTTKDIAANVAGDVATSLGYSRGGRAQGLVTDLATNFATSLRGNLTSEENIEKLLSTVLTSRVQRKAKDIVRAGINYVVFCMVILQTSTDIIGPTQNNLTTFAGLYEAVMSSSFGNVIGLSILFIFLLCAFIFVHATKFEPHAAAVTDEEVELAYEETNKHPAYDGILELKFPYRFKGPLWALPYFVLAVCIAIIVLGLMLYLDEQEEITETTSAALGGAVVVLLAVTTDFSEYWVHTRNQTAPEM